MQLNLSFLLPRYQSVQCENLQKESEIFKSNMLMLLSFASYWVAYLIIIQSFHKHKSEILEI